MKALSIVVLASFFIAGCASLKSDVDFLVNHGKQIGKIESQIVSIAEDAEALKKNGLKGLNANDALAVEQLFEDIEQLRQNTGK